MGRSAAYPSVLEFPYIIKNYLDDVLVGTTFVDLNVM